MNILIIDKSSYFNFRKMDLFMMICIPIFHFIWVKAIHFRSKKLEFTIKVAVK